MIDCLMESSWVGVVYHPYEKFTPPKELSNWRLKAPFPPSVNSFSPMVRVVMSPVDVAICADAIVALSTAADEINKARIVFIVLVTVQVGPS